MIASALDTSTFYWKSGGSKVIFLLTIVEGTCLDGNLQFRLMCGEFVQAYEGTLIDVMPWSADIIGLGLNGYY